MPTGSCYCGNIKYEYSGEPYLKSLCHCSACHKTSGSTHSTSIFLDESQFQLISGKPKTYTTRHEYGMKFELHFCDECSSLLWKTADAEQFKGKLALSLGTLDDPDVMNKLKPEKELYVGMRTKWVPEMEGLSQDKSLDSVK